MSLHFPSIHCDLDVMLNVHIFPFFTPQDTLTMGLYWGLWVTGKCKNGSGGYKVELYIQGVRVPLGLGSTKDADVRAMGSGQVLGSQVCEGWQACSEANQSASKTVPTIPTLAGDERRVSIGKCLGAVLPFPGEWSSYSEPILQGKGFLLLNTMAANMQYVPFRVCSLPKIVGFPFLSDFSFDGTLSFLSYLK